MFRFLSNRRKRRAPEPQASDRLDRIERLLTRVQRDVERMKLHTAVVLGQDRAVALLATGDRIYVDPRDGGCGMNLLSEGRYEEDEIRLFRRFLRPGIRVLDIGANYGYYSIVAAPYLRPGGRVIAFEPNPHIHDLLASSCYLNGCYDVVDPRRLGASSQDGDVRFEILESGPGGAHVIGASDQSYPDRIVIEVPVVALDEHLEVDAVVHLVKIDVEGHEEHVLRGMRRLIARSPDIAIFMEVFYPLFASDDDFVRLMHFITEELGMRMSRILAGGVTREVDAAALRGVTCNVILSHAPLLSRPDLTLYPEQLKRGQATRLTDAGIVWEREDDSAVPGTIIAHGPYVFLPKGLYRLVIQGDFTGSFSVALMENFGDPIWTAQVADCSDFTAEIAVTLDAPHLEVAFWPGSPDAARLLLRRIEFWPL